MEKECTRCHRTFHTNREDVTVCPECLKREFAAAPRLDGAEHRELVEEYKVADRRQRARAARLNESYNDEARFSMGGKMRLSFGLLLFGLCLFFYVLLSPEVGFLAQDRMTEDALRIISVLICIVAAVLVWSSSRRYRLLRWGVALLILVSGWYMPDWRQEQEDPGDELSEKTTQTKPAQTAVDEKDEMGGRVLTSSDLEPFEQLKKNSSPSVSQYAVYMDHQDARTREIVREALTRLLGAEYTRAYTRSGGALYVIANVPGGVRNISSTLSRFGKTAYNNPVEGVYELRFDAEKANLVSRYPVEVLTSPLNASFVTANLNELTSLDPMRVRAAALAFRNGRVKVLRREIHDALYRALQDPWGQDNDTYTALVEALVVYTEVGNKNDARICYRFFEAQRALQKEAPQAVTEYLVRSCPDDMVQPVLEYWYDNPLVWGGFMDALGIRVQAPLLQRLETEQNVGRQNAILKFLKEHGTAQAVPAVRKFAESTDSNILRRSAEEAVQTMRQR